MQLQQRMRHGDGGQLRQERDARQDGPASAWAGGTVLTARHCHSSRPSMPCEPALLPADLCLALQARTHLHNRLYQRRTLRRGQQRVERIRRAEQLRAVTLDCLAPSVADKA